MIAAPICQQARDPQTKRYRSVSFSQLERLVLKVNRNDTVSFYLQAAQPCIYWDPGWAASRGGIWPNRNEIE
jgi:hypothetical protein